MLIGECMGWFLGFGFHFLPARTIRKNPSNHTILRVWGLRFRVYGFGFRVLG